MGEFQTVKKCLAEFRPNGRNKVRPIFRAGMYEAKNTNRPASVEFVCEKQTNYARSRPAMPIA